MKKIVLMLAVAAFGTGAMAQTQSTPAKAAPMPKAAVVQQAETPKATDKKVGDKKAHKGHKHVVKPAKAETK